MIIIEIKSSENYAHRNQTIYGGTLKNIPEGWAVIPDNMATPNFPFGEVTTEKIDGVMFVTNWDARPIPTVDNEEVDEPTSNLEQLRAEIETLYKSGKLTEEEYNSLVEKTQNKEEL